MTPEEFRAAFGSEIGLVAARISRRYSVTDEEIALALYASIKKYLPEVVSASGRPKPDPEHGARLDEFISSLNCDDLCLAVACAKGDEAAWEDFFREYKPFLLSVARLAVRNSGAAEQLADSTFAELYGVRGSGEVRVSKFSFYSGRGSLKGWLRAVLTQLAIDSRRQTSRFVQTEEVEDIERLANTPPENPAVELSFIRQRYRASVSAALEAAITRLEPRDRLVLAYYYSDEMTLKEIGQAFRVHEATISRWLTKAQKTTRKLVEKSLEREHRFNKSEIKEAMELAAQEVDINVREYLARSVSADRLRESRMD
jgi:RNA polymerase sigma-70 factor (ECF subfamily)